MMIEVELYKKDGKYYGYLASTSYSCSGWKTEGYDTKEECAEELKDFLLEEFYTGEENDLIEEE
jgi:hypothetical protein